MTIPQGRAESSKCVRARCSVPDAHAVIMASGDEERAIIGPANAIDSRRMRFRRLAGPYPASEAVIARDADRILKIEEAEGRGAFSNVPDADSAIGRGGCEDVLARGRPGDCQEGRSVADEGMRCRAGAEIDESDGGMLGRAGN